VQAVSEGGGKTLSRIDPDTIYERLRALGKAHAEAKSAFNKLKRFDKALQAKLALEAMRKPGTSVAMADKIALGSDAYSEYLDAMADAEREMDAALIDYDTAKTWVELARSANANERERLRVLGMVG
jgi:multidrug resistance efflux pump